MALSRHASRFLSDCPPIPAQSPCQHPPGAVRVAKSRCHSLLPIHLISAVMTLGAGAAQRPHQAPRLSNCAISAAGLFARCVSALHRCRVLSVMVIKWGSESAESGERDSADRPAMNCSGRERGEEGTRRDEGQPCSDHSPPLSPALSLPGPTAVRPLSNPFQRCHYTTKQADAPLKKPDSAKQRAQKTLESAKMVDVSVWCNRALLLPLPSKECVDLSLNLPVVINNVAQVSTQSAIIINPVNNPPF